MELVSAGATAWIVRCTEDRTSRHPQRADPDRPRHVRKRDVTDEIVAAARELGAELIVMATEGRHGFLDAVRGSTRSVSWGEAGYAVLAVPAG